MDDVFVTKKANLCDDVNVVEVVFLTVPTLLIIEQDEYNALSD